MLQVADTVSDQRAIWIVAHQAAYTMLSHTGLYLTLGGGYARFNAQDFSQTTVYNEVLRPRKTVDTVGFLRAELFYQFNESWELALGASRYGTAEVQLGFPKYPNIVSILPLHDYKQHSLFYRTTRYSLVPTYNVDLGGRLRARVGLGVTCNRTKSHIEATYYAWFSGVPNRMISDVYPTESRTDWSGLVSLGGEYELFKHMTLGLSVAYALFNISVPTSPGALNVGRNRPSRDKVRVDAVEAALSLNFRR